MSKEVDQWNERYSDSEYYYGTEPNEFLKQQAHLIKSRGRVLCLAEGEGRNAVYLATLGFNATALDQSEMGLKKLETLARRKGVHVQTIHKDLSEFNIEPNQWDAIISIWCHIPRDLRKRVHLLCVNGLVKGGYFILESYFPKQLEYKTGGPPTAELMPSLSELQSDLKELNLIHAAELDRVVQEGRGHHGLSAVVQIVGRKE
jgi:SAM-dependent methyltransferase